MEKLNFTPDLGKSKFKWEDTELAFKYSIELPSNKSKLIKKFWIH